MPCFTVLAPQPNQRAFDLAQVSLNGPICCAGGGDEHVFAVHNSKYLSARFVGRSIMDGPFTLGLAVDASDHSLQMLRQFQDWVTALSARPMADAAHRPTLRDTRRIDVLRVADALADGASHREIAVAFYGSRRVGEEWNSSSDSLRSHVRRLVQHARRMAAGGWTELATSRSAQRQA